MKKYIVSAAVILIFAAYIFYQHSENSKQTAQQPVTIAATPAATGQTAPSETQTPAAGLPIAAGTAPAAGTPAVPQGPYKNGTYTSAVTDAVYGSIQLQVAIANGAVSDIQFLQYPDSPGHTTDVSNQSLPQLKSEAIKSQNSNVDIVSGATQTSQAFQQALAGVLSQAKS